MEVVRGWYQYPGDAISADFKRRMASIKFTKAYAKLLEELGLEKKKR